MRVAVIGAGSWGTTVAALAAHSNPTVLWARRQMLCDAINASSENVEYLPGFRLPYTLRAVSDVAEAVESAELVVMAVPSHGFREVFTALAGAVPAGVPVISLTKGIEQSTLMRMTEVMAEVAPGLDPTRFGVLTGPNLAREVMVGHPAAAVVAMIDQGSAARVQEAFMGPTFRVYRNTDVVGAEVAGAVKNVMAIAAGMAKGLGFGHNTLAALITRALAELTRLGVALGGEASTFAGLAGMGDLIVTCQSDESRNNRVGMALAAGKKLDAVIGEMKMVAEGVKSVRPILGLAEVHRVDMPIAAQVERVLYAGAHPREAVLTLMTRQAKAESA